MIKKLWKGDVELAITFWVYFFLAGIIFRAIFKFMGSSSVSSITSFEAVLFLIIYIFSFIYFPFIFISVWRSANKWIKNPYTKQRRKWLGDVAKIIIGINAVFFVVSSVSAVESFFSSIHKGFSLGTVKIEAEKSVRAINKQTPRMIDRGTELLNANFKEKVFSYNFKLVNANIETTNVATFSNRMRKQLLKSTCQSDFKDFFSNGLSVSFNYVDKQNHPVSQILIKPSDCGY